MSIVPSGCPVCDHPEVSPFKVIQGYDFFECLGCESLFLDPAVLARIDGGESLVTYDANYWSMELPAARQRAYGSSLARVAEAILYTRRDIDLFLDVGAGAGYLLDACRTYLPAAQDVFWGVEKYPPPSLSSERSKNLVIGDVADWRRPIDAGCCIEVIEHLTPQMVKGVLAGLALSSAPDALFIFNSGQPTYVKQEDPGYLDPTGRGHIVSYSVRGFDHLAMPYGFRAAPLPGKAWAFVMEKTHAISDPVAERIWKPTARNRALLNDQIMGSILYIAGLESARAYG